MSGILAIVNLDGAPVERRVFDALLRYLTPRGPDAQDGVIDGPVGLGHTLPRTTTESAGERQPLTLDGKTWIVADCRVDGRADLLAALRAAGSSPAFDAPDCELILRAYAVWGEDCVDHLLGDFAFVVWDSRRRKVFGVRDQLGLKPFFYAEVGRTVVVASELNCLRLYPGVSRRLDEVAIADFLVFGYGLDLDRSAFADVRRLPPAHSLVVSAGETRVGRYWRMPVEPYLAYRRADDYVEEFRSLLDLATRDRLRTDAVGVFMSGGLDSTTIAATAKRVARQSQSPLAIEAHTVVFDRIVADEERRYSTIAARAIGIPIRHVPMDDYTFPPERLEPAWYPPEPESIIIPKRALDLHREPVRRARVLLRGDGIDPTLWTRTDALATMVREQGVVAAAREFAWLLWKRKQVPRLGIRSLLRARGRGPSAAATSEYPGWLGSALQDRVDVRGRWRRFNATDQEDERPGLELTRAYWPLTFEWQDPGVMHLAGEVRYPFVDLRLVRFLNRLPPIPWAIEKNLLRIAMRDRLPRPILRRSKAPLAGNSLARLIPPAEARWWRPLLTSATDLEAFVDVKVLSASIEKTIQNVQARNRHRDVDTLRSCLRPVSLALWFQHGAYGNLRQHVDAEERHAEQES